MLSAVRTLAGLTVILGIASVSIAAVPQQVTSPDGSPALHAMALGSVTSGTSRFEPCMCPICMQFRATPAPAQLPTLGATSISLSL